MNKRRSTTAEIEASGADEWGKVEEGIEWARVDGERPRGEATLAQVNCETWNAGPGDAPVRCLYVKDARPRGRRDRTW